jgi:hypothetical protein
MLFDLKFKSGIVVLAGFVGLFCLALFAGCSQGQDQTTGVTNSSVATTGASTRTVTSATKPSGYFIAVQYKDKQPVYITLDDLKQLPQVTVTSAGNAQNGPTLLSVLQKAGIIDFSELSAYGLSRGRIAAAQITLTREQIDESVVLDLNNRGKSKLSGVNIPQDNWIIDLEKLEIK